VADAVAHCPYATAAARRICFCEVGSTVYSRSDLTAPVTIQFTDKCLFITRLHYEAKRNCAGFCFHFTISHAIGLKLFVISLEKCCVLLFTAFKQKDCTNVGLFPEILEGQVLCGV
jgi:hypothetical protein